MELKFTFPGHSVSQHSVSICNNTVLPFINHNQLCCVSTQGSNRQLIFVVFFVFFLLNWLQRVGRIQH